MIKINYVEMNIMLLFLSLKTYTSKNFALLRIHHNWLHYNTKRKRKEQANRPNKLRRFVIIFSRSFIGNLTNYGFNFEAQITNGRNGSHLIRALRV